MKYFYGNMPINQKLCVSYQVNLYIGIGNSACMFHFSFLKAMKRKKYAEKILLEN